MTPGQEEGIDLSEPNSNTHPGENDNQAGPTNQPYNQQQPHTSASESIKTEPNSNPVSDSQTDQQIKGGSKSPNDGLSESTPGKDLSFPTQSRFGTHSLQTFYPTHLCLCFKNLYNHVHSVVTF